MEIVHVAAEISPLAKVGGLGDAVFGLAKAHTQMKHHVEVILPKYDGIEAKNTGIVVTCTFAGKTCSNRIWKTHVQGVDVVLIDPMDVDFFKRGCIYGCGDDTLRFAYFAKAAVAYLSAHKKEIDILHLHDWHTSLAAPLYTGDAKIFLTIHNLAYQGVAPIDVLDKVGLDRKAATEFLDAHVKDSVNFLKSGIHHAHFVTTVSPTYAKEILLEHSHNQLSALLQKNVAKFRGILNGIDYEYWNPQTDPYLKSHFSFSMQSGKKKAQAQLRKALSLADEHKPLVCVITRLVPQKGPELIKQALLRTLEAGGQFILIGSPSDKESLERFTHLKRSLGGSKYVHIDLGFNEKLAHQVYAAADLFLVPSLFEPCGLTQMIAMRYGALPLVRKTGGLADTVFHEVNGFVFEDPTPEAINKAVDRALDVWYRRPTLWSQMVSTAMQSDNSWKKPAESYLELYQKLASKVFS